MPICVCTTHVYTYGHAHAIDMLIVYMSIHMFIRIHTYSYRHAKDVYAHICAHTYTCLPLVQTHIYRHVLTHVHTHVHTHVLYTCPIHMSIHMSIHTSIHMSHTHVHTHGPYTCPYTWCRRQAKEREVAELHMDRDQCNAAQQQAVICLPP